MVIHLMRLIQVRTIERGAMSALIRDFKYEDNSYTSKDGGIVGKRAALLQIQLPYETVETINESAQDPDLLKDLLADLLDFCN